MKECIGSDVVHLAMECVQFFILLKEVCHYEVLSKPFSVVEQLEPELNEFWMKVNSKEISSGHTIMSEDAKILTKTGPQVEKPLVGSSRA